MSVSLKKFLGRDRVAAEIAGRHGAEQDAREEKRIYDRGIHDSKSVEMINSDIPKAPSKDAAAGVQKVEAITLVWTKKELIIAYACIFLVFFMISLQQQIQFNVVNYVTSSFEELPLTGTTSIVSSIVGGIFRLPTGKFIDLIGRPEGFIIMIGFTTIGLIMMAVTANVQTYAAAQVFYWVGFDGMQYVMDVFMADTSSLKNRAYVFAFSTTPYIVTTFVGPRAGASYLKTSGWPWAYGTFAIVTPFITIPILIVFYRNQKKASKAGLLKREKSGRSFAENVPYYLKEFDVFGMLLICAGFVLVLLPFSLASYQAAGWKSGKIIAMLVIGIFSLVAFTLWERLFAPVSFIPFELLKDPSIWGACMLSNFVFISFYCWDSNFSPFLQAVHGLSVTDSGYVTNIYSIGSCFWAVVYAGLIRILGRFKYLAVAHLCLQILGVGLMIHFRQPHHGIGFVVMCQIMIAFGGGGLVISEQMAVMAAAPHKAVAIPLALIALFTSVGGAIGTAISGAIFTNKFPEKLNQALPGNATLNALLYGDLSVQLQYPFGTPERDAVILAYGSAMWYQTIAATVFLVPCFIFIGVWKDFRVKDLKTVKGTTL